MINRSGPLRQSASTPSVEVFVSKTVPVILTKRLTGLGMEGEVRKISTIGSSGLGL